MGTGLKRIGSKTDEWQSNFVSIVEEHGGKLVVYSLANPI
jgi:hypothetical protein